MVHTRQVRTAQVGSRVTLTCETTGFGDVAITWSRLGAQLPRYTCDI
jgi:hypothetical protein